MHMNRQTGGELFGLLSPVVDHRTSFAPVSHILQESERLARLAETHVVSKSGAKPPAPQKSKPGIALHLILAKLSLKVIRLRKQFITALTFQFFNKLLHPAISIDALYRQRCIGQTGAKLRCRNVTGPKLSRSLLGNNLIHILWTPRKSVVRTLRAPSHPVLPA